MTTGREATIIETVVGLVDTLVQDFDAVDLLGRLAERSTELLGMSAAGVILSDGKGALQVAAASSERSRLLEVFAVAVDAGPCIDCVRTGRPVGSHDLTAEARWPRFAAGAAEAGFRAVHAVPMRLRRDVIGVLTLLHEHPHTLDADDTRLAQALSDAATIGLLHERSVRHAHEVADQLQTALTSRVVIEQAKGVLAQAGAMTPEDAFTAMRSFARRHGQRLTDVAARVIAGSLDLATLTARS